MLFGMHVRRMRCSRYKLIWVQTRKKGKFFHHEDSRGAGWPHSWPCFEQKVGLETSWGSFQTELSSTLSAFNSSHRDNPSSTSSVWWAHPVETRRVLAFSRLSKTSLGNDSQKRWHQKLSTAHCWESAAPIHLSTSTGEHFQNYWFSWHT